MTKVAAVRVSGERDDLGASLAEQLGGAEPVLVLVFASPKRDLAGLLAKLTQRFPRAALLGSTTSGEFSQLEEGEGGASAFAIAGDFKAFTGLGQGLGADPEVAVARALEGHPSAVHGYPHRIGVVMLDPLAGHGEEAALLIATHLGEAPLVGGAAGDDLAMSKTSVSAGTTVSSDAIAFASLFSKVPLGIGVRHAHTALNDRTHTVTRAEGGVVVEIDGKNAWDVWRDESAVRAREVGLDPEGQPGAYLLRYEAGLRVGGEFKVRAPLAPRPDGGIQFATAMPEGTEFQIMETNVDGQVASAIAAARSAREQLGGAKVAGAVVFDCICRKLVLRSEYMPMLKAVSAELGGAPLAGFATYGEIAMNSGDMSGFHNTTTVVLAFPDAPR